MGWPTVLRPGPDAHIVISEDGKTRPLLARFFHASPINGCSVWSADAVPTSIWLQSPADVRGRTEYWPVIAKRRSVACWLRRQAPRLPPVEVT
jgi:hypothetical protein